MLVGGEGLSDREKEESKRSDDFSDTQKDERRTIFREAGQGDVIFFQEMTQRT